MEGLSFYVPIIAIPLIVVLAAMFFKFRPKIWDKCVKALVIAFIFYLGIVFFKDGFLRVMAITTLTGFVLFLFVIPLASLAYVTIVKESKNLLMRLLKWGIYIPVSLIVSFIFVFFQPGTGLDFDGAMESSDACRRAYDIVVGDDLSPDSPHVMENPKNGFDMLGVETFYWTRGDHNVVCSANHYKRSVTRFKVGGVSMLHLISKDDRKFKSF